MLIKLKIKFNLNITIVYYYNVGISYHNLHIIHLLATVNEYKYLG